MNDDEAPGLGSLEQISHLMRAWSLRMVLAIRDDHPGVARIYADQIQRHSHNPNMPRLPLGLGISDLDAFIRFVLDAASVRGSVAEHVNHDQMISQVCAEIPRFAPAEVVDEAIAVARRVKTTGRDAPSVGNLYATAVIAAWLIQHPWIAPNPEGARRILLQMILEAEAAAGGVPAAEAVVEISDAEAIDRLTAVLVPSEEVLSEAGHPELLRQVPINPDPSKRTLLELDLLESTKALMMEYPQRDSISDKMFLDLVGRCLSDGRSREARTAAHAPKPKDPK
ncbi:MAG: hypothetical protein ACRDT6_05200 [Micromonosporaceae bacterium]